MKLEFSGPEVEKILLEYAAQKWDPGTFNKVESTERYTNIKGVILSYEEPEIAIPTPEDKS